MNNNPFEGYPVRYVVTKVVNGQRVLFDVMQGQYTFATPEEAQRRLEAVRANNHPSVFKFDTATMEVRPVVCYPGHYDPTTLYFD